MRFNSKIFKNFSRAVLIILGLGFIIPLLWLLLTSLKGAEEVYTNPAGLPQDWMFSNYLDAIKKFPFMTYFMNSVVYTGVSTFCILFCVTLFTYATARMEFKWADRLQKFMQFGLVIPGGCSLLGMYNILLKMNLIDTRIGLILLYISTGLPIACVIFYGFFRSLPISMEEAAALDGAGTFTTFFRVILPMVTPAITTVSVTAALGRWNEFTLASILLNSNKLKTLPVGIASFMTSRGGDWGDMAAAMVMASIPVIILYLCCSEKLEDALATNTGLK